MDQAYGQNIILTIDMYSPFKFPGLLRGQQLRIKVKQHTGTKCANVPKIMCVWGGGRQFVGKGGSCGKIKND